MANPVLTQAKTSQLISAPTFTSHTQPASVTRASVARVLALYLAVAGIAAIWGARATQGPTHHVTTAPLVVTALSAMVLGFVIQFKPSLARPLGIVYALAEGAVLGVITGLFNQRYPGIATQALGATGATALTVGVLYATGAVKVTNRLRNTIAGATVGVLVFYLVSWLVSLFSHTYLLASATPVGIAVSAVICVIAAANLLIDFDQVDRAVAAGLDASASWYLAFGLLVTLVWMYLEILRLLSKLRN